MTRHAVFGGGVMGETIIGGFLDAGVAPSDVAVAERRPERRAELAQALGITTFEANQEAAAFGDVAWLAVKPQDAVALLDEISDALHVDVLVASICAGLPTDLLEAHLRPGTSVVRVMPNTPARIGAGMSAVSAGAHASDEQVETVRALMAQLGDAIVVPESSQDAVTATSGSGPAYLFAVAEAMTAAGESLGLSDADADRLVRATLLGAAKLLATADVDAAELRRRVTSPKGTTAAALDVFAARDLEGVFREALGAAARRSAELADEARD